jgi:APA family basic amino acid/polyamine antiporter
MPAAHDKVKLKRGLGLFEVTIYGIGIILGAGIYALIGKAAGVAGNALWFAFLIGAIIASLTGLSYAELGTMYPKAAAEYVYAKRAFKNKLLPFLVGWLIIFIEIVAGATVALGFGGYFYVLTGINPIFAAIGLILILSFMNFFGIKQSAKANIVFTIIEIAGLLIIIFLAGNFYGSVNYLEMSPLGFGGIFAAAILVFFAYIGFEDVVNVAEETKKPRKVIPKAIVISIIITTIIYILLAMAAVSIVPYEQLGVSNAPLADVSEAAWPGSSMLLSIIALFATANTVLIILIVSSRMLYGMSKYGPFPKPLSKIHESRKTPWISIIIIGIVSMSFVLIGDIKLIAEITTFGSFLIFLSVNVALIWLRYKRPLKRRPFKSPINIGKFPVLAGLGAAFSFFMLIYFELLVVLGSLGVIFVGFLAYLALRRKI